MHDFGNIGEKVKEMKLLTCNVRLPASILDRSEFINHGQEVFTAALNRLKSFSLSVGQIFCILRI
jgi:hypothetical protein